MTAPIESLSNARPVSRVRTDEAANAHQVADAFIAIWQAVETAVSPVVGQRGMAAAFEHSLQRTAGLFPWLQRPPQVDGELGLPALRSLLALRPETQAAAAGAELWRTFHEVLSRLIGPALTGRLLRVVKPPRDAASFATAVAEPTALGIGSLSGGVSRRDAMSAGGPAPALLAAASPARDRAGGD
jgi:hypothetical protein